MQAARDVTAGHDTWRCAVRLGRPSETGSALSSITTSNIAPIWSRLPSVGVPRSRRRLRRRRPSTGYPPQHAAPSGSADLRTRWRRPRRRLNVAEPARRDPGSGSRRGILLTTHRCEPPSRRRCCSEHRAGRVHVCAHGPGGATTRLGWFSCQPHEDTQFGRLPRPWGSKSIKGQ